MRDTHDARGSGHEVRSLRELPRELRPARDLWPELAVRLDPRPITDRAPRWRLWDAGVVAAMAVAVVATGVALVVWMHRDRAPTEQLVSASGGTSTVHQLISSDDAREHDALVQTLNARLATLPPASRRRVLADLNVIEQSMRDVRAALGRDPGNALLQELLTQTYQDERHLLAIVQEAGVWTSQATGANGTT
jgi:hypothetical protein